MTVTTLFVTADQREMAGLSGALPSVQRRIGRC
jgi:hypothetical protein